MQARRDREAAVRRARWPARTSAPTAGGPASGVLPRACAARRARRQRAHRRGRRRMAAPGRRVEKQPFIGRRRRRLAAVPGLDGLAIPEHHEGAATDAAGLRLDQPQHHLRRDRRIERRAAGAQHLHPCFGCERVGRDDGLAIELPARLDAGRGGEFGLAGSRWLSAVALRRASRSRRPARRAARCAASAWRARARLPSRPARAAPGGAYFGASRIAPSRRITSPLSISLVTI